MAGTRSSNDMARTRSSNDRTQSLFLSWPCLLLWRLYSQEGFLCRVIKMPPTVLYHPSSLLIPGKGKRKKVVTKCWRKSLLGLAWVIWPFLVQSVRPGRWSTLATCALFVYFCRGWSQPYSNDIAEKVDLQGEMKQVKMLPSIFRTTLIQFYRQCNWG